MAMSILLPCQGIGSTSEKLCTFITSDENMSVTRNMTSATLKTMSDHLTNNVGYTTNNVGNEENVSLTRKVFAPTCHIQIHIRASTYTCLHARSQQGGSRQGCSRQGAKDQAWEPKAAVQGLGLVRQCGDSEIAIHLHSSGICDLIWSRRQSNEQFNNVAHRVLLIRPRIVSTPWSSEGIGIQCTVFPSTQMLVAFGSQRVGPTCMVGPTRPLPIRIAKIKTNMYKVRGNHQPF